MINSKPVLKNLCQKLRINLFWLYLIRNKTRTEQGKQWLVSFTIESLHYKLIFTEFTRCFLIVRQSQKNFLFFPVVFFFFFKLAPHVRHILAAPEGITCTGHICACVLSTCNSTSKKLLVALFSWVNFWPFAMLLHWTVAQTFCQDTGSLDILDKMVLCMYRMGVYAQENLSMLLPAQDHWFVPSHTKLITCLVQLSVLGRSHSSTLVHTCRPAAPVQLL